jgi:transglutaminase-like putative cysteine protease
LSKFYQIRHVTRYRYETDIAENVMEVRKCPLTIGNQRCMSFEIKVEPGAQLFRFKEHCGNIVHHFDIPQKHNQMILTAEALVEIKDSVSPQESLTESSWEELAGLENDAEFLDYTLPSPLIKPTDALRSYYESVQPRANEGPLAFLRRLNQEIAGGFEYVPLSTQVDSPLDQALTGKQGVCQDFAHIMVGVARLAKIPARYVSGYLFHRAEDKDRSSGEATHAWMEAYLPGYGWLGFDPTNNILAGERHIVICFGRDYKDVPPTRGVYRGLCASELSVAVQIHPADAPHGVDQFRRMDESDLSAESWLEENPWAVAQQQQQQ